MDWGTRRKPLGAIVAWSSLALFAMLAILGIAGVVVGMQHRAPASADAEVAAAPEPAPVEERLPDESLLADAAMPAEATKVDMAPAEVVEVAEALPVAPELSMAVERDDMIASTFEQLVEPVVVPASQVPQGAVATAAAPAEMQVASSDVKLPMSSDGATRLSGRPGVGVGRNAAAWAIESEVPDTSNRGPALGYAAQPADDGVQVGDSSINVRSGPTQGNKKLFALAAGADVEVVGKANGWVSITDGRGRTGWVDATLLQNLDLSDVPNAKTVPAAEEPAKTNVKKVAGSGVTVRSGPGKSNKQLFNLAGGSAVTVIDDSKGWLKIKDTNGRTGWAYKSYIRG